MRSAGSQRLEPLESRQLYASDAAVVVTMPSSFIDYTMPIGSALVSIHVAFASPANARATTAGASSSPGRTSKTAAPRDRDDDDEDDKAESARAAGAFASNAAIDHGEPASAAHHLAPAAVDFDTPTPGAAPASARKATLDPVAAGHSKSTFSVLAIAEAASAEVVQHTLATAAAAMPFVVAANGVIRQSLQGLVASPMQPAAMRYFFERVQAQSAIGQSIERFILECAALPRSLSTPPRSRLAAWVVTAGVLMIDLGVALIIIRRRRRGALRPAMLARRARLAAGV